MPVSVSINAQDLRDLRNDLDLLSRVFDEPGHVFADIIAHELVDAEEEVFATDGYGEWPERVDDLPHPLLRKTLRLYDSLTDLSDPENILIESPHQITFGTQVEYSIFHEAGTSRIPQRSFLEILADHGLDDNIANVAEDYLQSLLS